MSAAYLVTRPVAKDEPNNTTGRDVEAGETLYEFTGVSYGCCDTVNGVIVTTDPRGGGTFAEFPKNAVAMVRCSHRGYLGQHCAFMTCRFYKERCPVHAIAQTGDVCNLDLVTEPAIIARKITRGLSMACSKGDHLGCPGMSCSCSCHK